ncbi:MAG: hypothetical protein ABIT01_17210, partial [Thermoanaerobaculia bacterium]
MLHLAVPLLLATLASPTTPAAATGSAAAGSPAEAFRARHLSGRTIAASNLTFRVGGGGYTLLDGSLREIVGKDDRPIGFFFEGHGRLSWAVEENESAAAKVYSDNARRVGGFDVGKDRSLTASFTRASLYFAEKERPSLGDPAAANEDASAAYAKHQARFAQDRFPAPELGLAAARANGGVYYSALLEGSRDVRHEVDDVLGNEETLAVVSEMESTPTGFIGWRFSREVAHRPVGRGRHAHPRFDYRLVDVDVDIREGAGGRGTLLVDETVVPERPVRALSFELYSEKLVNKGFTEARTLLSAVTDDRGKPIAHAFAKGQLVLFFPEPLAAHVPLKLRFEYDGGFFGRSFGDNYWDLELGAPWYPRPVSTAAAAHTFHAVIRARKPFTPFASGDVVRRE